MWDGEADVGADLRKKEVECVSSLMDAAGVYGWSPLHSELQRGDKGDVHLHFLCSFSHLSCLHGFPCTFNRLCYSYLFILTPPSLLPILQLSLLLLLLILWIFAGCYLPLSLSLLVKPPFATCKFR
ncbi:hypothetical protein RIF29_22230 [Crotalaria pallida]|uniref:Uncharacterized protein n=1 Tax=Crotalaria pallida TaxID=3830 RepID=A0AAN9I973_CROPI